MCSPYPRTPPQNRAGKVNEWDLTADCQGGATLHLFAVRDFPRANLRVLRQGAGGKTGREIRRRIRPVQAAERTCRPLTHLIVRFVEPEKRVRDKNAPKNKNAAVEGWRRCRVQAISVGATLWRSLPPRHLRVSRAFHENLRQYDAALTLKNVP